VVNAVVEGISRAGFLSWEVKYPYGWVHRVENQGPQDIYPGQKAAGGAQGWDWGLPFDFDITERGVEIPIPTS